MTHKKYIFITLLLAFLLIAALLPAVFAEDAKTLIQSGKTVWRYQVTNTEDFYRMDEGWNQPGYDTSSWKRNVTPFGDKESFSGWKGNDHGIYLVTTFTLDEIPKDTSLDFSFYYDNTVKVYLNGELIYEDERWNDKKEKFVFPTDHLVKGENTLAISILDDVGGRGFDLDVSLVPKSSEEITAPDTAPIIPEDAGTPLIVSSHTVWEYTVTTTEGFGKMDEDWKTLSYDRSSWKKGVGPFGTNINGANANRTGWKDGNHGIFLTTTFEIDDLEKAKSQYYYMDIYFDNTITIYCNGKKVFSRDDWNTSYEEIAIGLKNALVEGTNIFAVSLLDDVGGREFDMSLFMTEKVMSAGTEVSDSELKAAGLPIIRIDTDNGDYVRSRLEYVTATMVFDNMGAYPNEDNIYTEAGGAPIEIRGRGNSTWNNGYRDGKPNTLAGDTHTRKVPYNIKLDEKVNLFGMGTSKKWVLLANYMDRSNLRNKLIFDLSGRMGMNYAQSIFVNLVLNGEYMGVYALCEKVDIDLFGGEVTDFEDYAEDFAKAVAKKMGYNKDWRDSFEEELCENLSWLTEEYYKGYKVSDYVDLSGVSTETGYLIEYDGYADEDSFFHTDHGVPLKVSNLEGIKSNDAVFKNLKQYFKDFEEALFSDTFYNSKGKHYSEYVDMPSFVDYFILNTLILNVEFGYKSMYMVLASDGKLILGPCWDYDWSSGNKFLGANGQYDHWYNDGRASNNKWYREAYGDPWFVALVRERWASLSPAVNDMIDSMTVYEEYLTPSSTIEYRKFKADSYETDFKGRTGGRSFAEEVAQLRSFLLNRTTWLDAQFLKRDPNIEGFGMKLKTSLSLSLAGDGIKKGTTFDYASANTSGSATMNLRYTQNATAKIYVNGLQYQSLTLYANTTSTQEINLEGLDKGVNVITVYLYDQSSNLIGTNYLSLSTPGEKQVAPTLGSYLPNTQEEPPTPPTPPDTTETPETTVTPGTTETPVTTEAPESSETPDEPTPPEQETLTLSSDDLSVYTQKKEEAGSESLRIVFVADRAYLYRQKALTITVTFSTNQGNKTYVGQLAYDSTDYSLYLSVTAGGTTYVATGGDLLFGNVFTDIPKGVLTSVTVSVSNQAGNTVLGRKADIS